MQLLRYGDLLGTKDPRDKFLSLLPQTHGDGYLVGTTKSMKPPTWERGEQRGPEEESAWKRGGKQRHYLADKQRPRNFLILLPYQLVITRVGQRSLSLPGWSPLVSSGLLWSPLVSSGLLWSPLVSSGLLWSPLVSSGSI